MYKRCTAVFCTVECLFRFLGMLTTKFQNDIIASRYTDRGI